jgi:hypothetical protein
LWRRCRLLRLRVSRYAGTYDVTGSGVSGQDGPFSITGRVDDTGDVAATFGTATMGATWRGTIVGDAITGTWTNTYWGQSGTGIAVRR